MTDTGPRSDEGIRRYALKFDTHARNPAFTWERGPASEVITFMHLQALRREDRLHCEILNWQHEDGTERSQHREDRLGHLGARSRDHRFLTLPSAFNDAGRCIDNVTTPSDAGIAQKACDGNGAHIAQI